MQISVTITGLDRTEERLAKLGTGLHDFTGALTSLGARLIMFYSQTVFASEGTALGEHWRPLAASTDAEKARHWEGRPMLVRTGAMQGGFYSEITPQSLFISNKVSYFPFQQLGTRKMPARPMLGIGSRVEAMIKTTIEADVKAKIESTNL